jgi:RES domain-containing protein
VIPVSSCSFPSSHRLIASRYSEEGTVLSELADNESELNDLIELDGSTNDRLRGESGLLPGIGVHELIFGVPYGNIVNAAFTHASPAGGRFNDRMRGAWYAGLEFETSAHEVAYHRLRELKETDWREEEVSTYDDYLADVTANFHDLRGGKAAFKQYLRPAPVPQCYGKPQELANRLLEQGSNGVVYPSVRHEAGTCVACFRPALVYHVRRSHRWEFRLRTTRPFSLDSVKQID